MAGQNGADGARPRGFFAVRQRYRLRGGVDAGVCAGGGGAGGGDENAAGDRIGLEAFADGQEQARLDGMFETVRAGYRLLSARYPDYVRVLGERDPENMMQRPERRPLEGQKEEKDEKL